MERNYVFVLAAVLAIAVLMILLSQSFPSQPETNRNVPPGETNIYREFTVQRFDSSLPLPNLPEGQTITTSLGDITATYFSTAVIRGNTESGEDFFITLRNNGKSDVAVNFPSQSDLARQVPSWNMHFFSFQDSPVVVPAGGERKLWFYASLDIEGSSFTVNFRLWLDDNRSVELPVKFGSTNERFTGKETSLIYGYIKDQDGNPVTDLRIDAQMNCGRWDSRGDSDERGTYSIAVLASEDIASIYGDKELSCNSTDYFVFVYKDGYELYYKSGISPTRGNLTYLNITLQKAKDSASYKEKWAAKVDDKYGLFWVKPSGDWSVFAASQAKHPPVLDLPTNFYLFDSSGNVLWKQPTGNECWGIDITKDGNVAAGCSDYSVYMVNRNGSLAWKTDLGQTVRSLCFSNDGSQILTGTVKKIYLMNSSDGSKQDIPWADEWFRNCKFFYDGSGFVVGSRIVAAFDSMANEKWRFVMGEFPMFLGVDNSGNVYAAGKSRTLFSFDKSGNLRWKFRISDHTVPYGSVTPDGSRIALGTVGGMVYLFDGEGNLLWKRSVEEQGGPSATVGHNAVAITPDGKRIVVGTAPGNCVFVYNENGTILWKGCSNVEKSSPDMLEGVTNVQISDDYKKIIVSYGDNYIRMFEAL